MKFRTRPAFIEGKKKASKRCEIRQQAQRMGGIVLEDHYEADNHGEMKSANTKRLSVFRVDVEIEQKLKPFSR